MRDDDLALWVIVTMVAFVLSLIVSFTIYVHWKQGGDGEA